MIDSERNVQEDGTPQATQDVERLRRLARAINASDQPDTQICRQVQQILPRLAEAELRGERISRIFPAEVRHMDICEDCALAYAELLDVLLSLEAVAEQPLASLPPALPARLELVMRLRGWVLRLSGKMVAALQLADPANFEAAAQALLERLPQLPQVLTPRQTEQLALGWGADPDAARVMLACWDATEQIVGRYTPGQLDELAANGRLPDVARLSAEDTARRLKLGKLRHRFVDIYVADVRGDPSSLAALARLNN